MIADPVDPSAWPAPRRRRASRRRLAWAGLAVVLAAAGYAVLWFQVATRLKDGIEAWVAMQRQNGIEIGFEHLRLEGFPLAWRARVEAPVVQAVAPGGALGGRLHWRWRPERITLSIRPWRPDTWVIDASGAHALELPAAQGVVRINGQIAAFDAAYTRAAGGGALVVNAAGVSGVAEPGGEFALGALDFEGRTPPHPQPADHLTVTATASLRASAVRLPAAWASPLADRVGQASLAVQVLGRIAPPFDGRALADWRDDGGTLEVTALGFTHGTLNVEASGTMALDGDMQPIGAFTARAQGFLQAVDALQAAGVIAPSDAVTARIVLSALARRDGSGAASLSVPVQIQAGVLHAGPVPLARVPRIVWPGLP